MQVHLLRSDSHRRASQCSLLRCLDNDSIRERPRILPGKGNSWGPVWSPDGSHSPSIRIVRLSIALDLGTNVRRDAASVSKPSFVHVRKPWFRNGRLTAGSSWSSSSLKRLTVADVAAMLSSPDAATTTKRPIRKGTWVQPLSCTAPGSNEHRGESRNAKECADSESRGLCCRSCRGGCPHGKTERLVRKIIARLLVGISRRLTRGGS